MAKNTTSKDTTAVPAEERKAKRRARMRSLMTGNAASGGADGGGADTAARRKAVARIYRVLADTPADNTGTVEGTSFSQAGVVRLMENLQSRADSDGQAGSKAATRMLKFLSPKEGEAAVHGVSVKRLQQISKTGENRSNAAGKSGRGKGGKRRAP